MFAIRVYAKTAVGDIENAQNGFLFALAVSLS